MTEPNPAPAGSPQDGTSPDRLETALESIWSRRLPGDRWWQRAWHFIYSESSDSANTRNMSSFLYEERHIKSGLEVRYSLLESAAKRLSASIKNAELPDIRGIQNPEIKFSLPSLGIWQLATIDVFVEKAQYFLTVRADKQEKYGRCAMRATVITMLLAFGLAFWFFLQKSVPESSGPAPGNVTIIIHFLGFITVLAPILGIAYFSTALARAFFHEATTLRNRRHSVRLGRLLLHLKVSSAKSDDELEKIIKDLNIAEMERAFGWNIETSTAFKDIDAAAMTTGLIPQLLAILQKKSDSQTEPLSRP